MKKKTNFAAIFSICAVMYSAYVGPGFASGTQTVSYFLNKGWIGVFVGPLVAGLLCFVFNKDRKDGILNDNYDLIDPKEEN